MIARLLDCKITKLTCQQDFKMGCSPKYRRLRILQSKSFSESTCHSVGDLSHLHLDLCIDYLFLYFTIQTREKYRAIIKKEIVMYYLPSSSPGKPHVVALDKEVGALLGCILFSIIVIIMVMIRRGRRRMPGGQPSPARSSPTETNPSRCLCFALADFMRSLIHPVRIVTMLYDDNEEKEEGDDD